MTFHQFSAAVAAAAALIVSACGGGGGGEGGGIGGTGISYGGISALGSIWVNGVEFDTTTTAVRIDDNPGVAADLKKGMVVRVDGSFDASRADNVLVEGSLKGFVERRIDANRFTLMGQTIQTDDLTVFDPAFVPAVGERVEVHGLVVADGVIAGGLVARKTTAPTPPFAVKGLVKNHDSVAKTFGIGALTVNYATATSISDLPTASSWNGQLVEVKGDACAGNPTCDVLQATRVHASGVRVDNIGRAEVEGFVTAAVVGAGASFTIGTQPVSTGTGTVFVGGVLADVLLGSKLEVEGAIRGGVLVASKVRFLDSIRLEADVASRGATSLMLVGMPGIVVGANALTVFDGFANLAAVQPGDHVRVRARPAPGGGVVALQVELRNGGNGDTILQATVDAFVAPNSVTLLGQVVDTSTIANNEFQGLNDAAIGRSAFFAALRVNTLVKARGTPNGNAIVWNQIELED